MSNLVAEIAALAGKFQSATFVPKKLDTALMQYSTSKLRSKLFNTRLEEEVYFKLVEVVAPGTGGWIDIDVSNHNLSDTEKMLRENLICESRAFIAESQFNRALKQVQECIRISPYWSKGFVQLGHCYLCMGKKKEAQQAFQQAKSWASSSLGTFTRTRQNVIFGIKY